MTCAPSRSWHHIQSIFLFGCASLFCSGQLHWQSWAQRQAATSTAWERDFALDEVSSHPQSESWAWFSMYMIWFCKVQVGMKTGTTRRLWYDRSLDLWYQSCRVSTGPTGQNCHKNSFPEINPTGLHEIFFSNWVAIPQTPRGSLWLDLPVTFSANTRFANAWRGGEALVPPSTFQAFSRWPREHASHPKSKKCRGRTCHQRPYLS